MMARCRIAKVTPCGIAALLLFACAPDAMAQCAMDLTGVTGLMSGIMINFENCIESAPATLLPQITTTLTPYLWASITLCLTLFGIRTVTLAHENVLKEGAGLLFKIAIAIYIFFNALNIYNGTGSGIFTGTGGLMGVMNEMIGWVGGQTPWGTMDTIWLTLMGASTTDLSLGATAAAPTTQTAAFYGSLAAFSSLALFTNVTGVTVFILAVQALLSVLFMVMRVMFMILLAYFGLALMMIIAPVIAPLLIFSSHNPQSYTKQIFEKWYGIILATILEPVFIIAIFGMAVSVLDMFIDTGVTMTGIDSMMSLSSLLGKCNASGSASGSSGNNIEGCVEPDSVMASHCQVGDPQAHNTGSSSSSGYNWDWASQQPFPGLAQANQACANGGTMNIAVSRLRATPNSSGTASSGGGGAAPVAPLSLMVVMLVAIIIITYVLEDMISSMAKVARHIAGAAGMAMFEVSQAPIESAMKSITDKAGAAMKQSAQKTMNPVTNVGAAARAAASQLVSGRDHHSGR